MDAEIHLKRRIGELEKKWEDAQAQLEAVQSATESAWDDMKDGASRTCDEMGETLRSAMERFRA